MLSESTNVPGKFLFCTYVYGWYQSFIPIYIYSLLKSYPEYSCRILLREQLNRPIKAALKIVRKAVEGSFVVVPGFMPQLQGTCSGMRWLLDQSHFQGYDYGWIGDVDFIHVRESTSFLEQEIKRANAIGKPYANVVRQAPGYERTMTGMHFIVVTPYFQQMQPVIARALQDPHIMLARGVIGTEIGAPSLSRGSISIPSTGSDEFLLYHLVKSGCGVLEASEERPYRHQSHHGLHLGSARAKKPWPKWLLRDGPLQKAIGEILNDSVLSSMLPLLDHRVADCVQKAREIVTERLTKTADLRS